MAAGKAKTWKFGAMWVGKKASGKKKMFKTRKQAAAFAGTSKKRKNNPKKKTRRTKAKGAIKRAGRRAKRGASKVGSKRRAISVNLAKTAAIAGTVGLMSGAIGGSSVFDAIKSGNISQAMARMWINFKANWFQIVSLNVGVALLSRIAGKFAPSAGVKGAINVKAF